SLESVHHADATTVTLTPLPSLLPSSDRQTGACTSGTFLFNSAAEYEAFLRSRLPDGGALDGGANDGGADGDAGDGGSSDGGSHGPDAGGLIDWTSQSLLVIGSSSNSAFTAGTEGDALILAEGHYCQGVPPMCEIAAYAVPKVQRIVHESCPAP